MIILKNKIFAYTKKIFVLYYLSRAAKKHKSRQFDCAFFMFGKGEFMNKKLDVANDNINKLLLAFSIPCVISMLINAFYNIIDQIFIGKGVGTIGNAATNVIFPIVIICNAIASLIGNGCAANLSLKSSFFNLTDFIFGI